MPTKTPYLCPSCAASVTRGPAALRCDGCGRVFSENRGIPAFANPPRVWQKRGVDAALNEAIRQDGFQAATHEHLDERTRGWACNPRRANPLYVANIGPRTKLLDAGCGWGSLTIGIADLVEEVHAIDVSDERLEFIQLWAEHLELSNVHVAKASVLDLNFQQEYFDAVVLSGVLEWTAEFAQSPDPEQTQRDVLHKARSVLAPGGQLLLMIENRLGLPYWLGVPDEHTDMRFITLMPRKAARLFHRIQKQRPYRAYTHTRRWLVRNLLGAGFSHVKTYATLPNYRAPWNVVDMDSPAAWRAFCNSYQLGSGDSLRRRTATSLWQAVQADPDRWRRVVREFAPAYMMVATR